MMPVIRVSDATWERMKSHARPLEDTADDIVRRALDALEGATTSVQTNAVKKGRPSKAKAADHLPQKEFRKPLLLALHRLGGKGTKKEVTKAVLPQVKDRLQPADHVMMETGELRWENAVAWERNDLKKEGYLLSDSERGVWELSELGRTEAMSLARAESH